MTARTDHGGEPGVFCAAVEACAHSRLERMARPEACNHACCCVCACSLSRQGTYTDSIVCDLEFVCVYVNLYRDAMCTARECRIMLASGLVARLVDLRFFTSHIR